MRSRQADDDGADRVVSAGVLDRPAGLRPARVGLLSICLHARLLARLPEVRSARSEGRREPTATATTPTTLTQTRRPPPGLSFGGRRTMSEGDQKALGEMRAAISREIVRLQAEYYGKGPTK